MKLLSLESSNPKFRKLVFKPGLNIVTGIQLSKADRKTYNGIGKSLSLSLLHYMLGATVDGPKLKSYLAEYGDFTLTFEVAGKVYKIRKDFSSTDFLVDGVKVNASNYPSLLDSLFIPSRKELSFRQVLNCFARRYGGTYYTDALVQQGQGIHDYPQRFVNFQLLGIDIDLVEKKHEVKEKIGKLDKAADVVSEYEKELGRTNSQDLVDQIASISERLANFQIAEEFDLLTREANELTESANQLRNSIFEGEKRVARLSKALELAAEVSIDLDEVRNIYNEMKFFFTSKVSVRLEQAEAFHRELVINRRARIEKDIAEIRSAIAESKTALSAVTSKRDKLLKSLDSSGALEEYDSLNSRLKQLQEEKSNLDKYQTVLNEFRTEKTKLNTQNSRIMELSVEYILKSATVIGEKEKIFRSFVKRFYDSGGGSLKLVETKDAKYLYNIDLHVPKEGSQGVGEVKIFCYDLLLFMLNKDLLGFLAHDGCIFSEMDPRQKTTLFKIVLETVRDQGLQYFVNINENTLNDVLRNENKMLTQPEIDGIRTGIILELNDKNPSNWLFGEAFG